MSDELFEERKESRPTPVAAPGPHDDGMSEPGAPKLSRQRENLSRNMVDASEEIERLRLRQEELEKERRALEELSSKQTEYERGKKETVEKLQKSIIWIEKEEQQAQRMVEIFSETRSRFRQMLNTLTAINETGWSETVFEVELNKALVTVDMASTDMNKALSRIEAASWHKDVAGNDRGNVLDAIGQSSSPDRGFLHWMKIGLAFSLPLIVIILVFVVVSIVRTSY